MPDHGHHCPFLNRADSRCAQNLSLDALGYAFDYCFGYYEGCCVYLEQLDERRTRRAMVRAPHPAEEVGHDTGDRLVQLTIAGRIRQGTADPAIVSHAPGL